MTTEFPQPPDASSAPKVLRFRRDAKNTSNVNRFGCHETGERSEADVINHPRAVTLGQSHPGHEVVESCFDSFFVVLVLHRREVGGGERLRRTTDQISRACYFGGSFGR